MKGLLIAASVLLSASVLPMTANAAGCIKGAIVGGVAGHMLGHGKAGAAAGCVIGHHKASQAKQNNQGSDQQGK